MFDASGVFVAEDLAGHSTWWLWQRLLHCGGWGGFVFDAVHLLMQHIVYLLRQIVYLIQQIVYLLQQIVYLILSICFLMW